MASLLLISCSQSGNSDSVVTKYINGFINSNTKAIWEASSDAYLNDLLSKQEQNSSYNEFSTHYKDDNFPLFNKNIHFEILNTEKIHDTHAEVFVEITYSVTNPYKINRYKSAKKTLVKINTKRIKNDWTVDKIQLEEIIEYNQDYDMQQAEKLIEEEINTNITTAINTFNNIANSYSDYFDNLESISQKLEKAKLKVFNKEKQNITSNNYRLINVKNSNCSNKNYGSYIKGRIENNLSTAIINVQVKAEFRTYEYSESGWDCNSLKWESKSFTKYFTVKNIYPGKSKSFDEFFDIKVTGKTQKGFCFGSGKTRTVSIKDETLRIAPNSVEISGMISN